MDKHSKNSSGDAPKQNYTLKSEAVNELVNADTSETPEYTEEELRKYRKKSKFHIPMPVKVLFIKMWFCGAVCFFFLWGLGGLVPNLIDMLFITGIAMGMVTDLLLNNTIRFIEEYSGANDNWIFILPKGVKSLVLNVLYNLVIVFCVFMTYNLINYVMIQITGKTDVIYLGVEPILFGVFCTAFDMLFVGIKRLLINIITDSKNAAKGN